MESAAKKTPEIIRFIERDEAKVPDFFLPSAKGVVVAGIDLMRAAELSSGPHRELNWKMMDEVWGTSADGNLEVAKFGDYWFLARKGDDFRASETLVEAFGRLPVCTPVCRDAMLLAEYCDPTVGELFPGHWLKFQ